MKRTDKPLSATQGEAERGMMTLSHLQRYYRQRGQDDGYYPEADGNLALMDGRMRYLYKIPAVRVELRIEDTEVVVNRSTLKDALLHSTPLSQFIIPHLVR